MKQIDINIKNIIKQYFSKLTQIQKHSVNKFLKNNHYIQKYLQQYLIQVPQWLSIQNIILGIHKNITPQICKTCGKLMNFKKYPKTYCSAKCSNADIQIKKKISNSVIQTNLKRYNVTSTAKLSWVKKNKN